MMIYNLNLVPSIIITNMHIPVDFRFISYKRYISCALRQYKLAFTPQFPNFDYRLHLPVKFAFLHTDLWLPETNKTISSKLFFYKASLKFNTSVFYFHLVLIPEIFNFIIGIIAIPCRFSVVHLHKVSKLLIPKIGCSSSDHVL